MKTRNQIIKSINWRKNFTKRELKRLSSSPELINKNYNKVAILRGKLSLLKLCVSLALKANKERVQEIHNLSKVIFNTTESTCYGAFCEEIYNVFLRKKDGIIVNGL